MPDKKSLKQKSFYSLELTASERRNFPSLRSGNPGDEIALLRVLVRRMLYTLNHINSFPEAIQTVNALSYLVGRLAKLFEVQSSQGEASSDFSLEEMTQRLESPLTTASQPPFLETANPGAE